MLTTGLLSLNVHDFNTFEGTELCLHPDLFSASPETTQKNNVSGIGSASIGSGNSAGTSIHSTIGLSEGDTIEIRLWDPLPKEAGMKSPSHSVGMRKRFQQAPILPATAPSAASNLHGSLPVGRENSMASMSSTHTANHQPESTGNPLSLRPRTGVFSMQPSVDPTSEASKSATSSPKSNSSQNKSFSDHDDSTKGVKSNSFTTHAAAIVGMHESLSQQHLPPVFPRNRSGTADASNAHSLSATKPPKPHSSSHRRASSTSGAMQTTQRSPKHPAKISKHSRDISDMTADTTLQLENLIGQVHRPDSPDTTLDEGVASESNPDPLSQILSTHRLRLSFVMKVTGKTLTCLKENSRTQISVLRRVADLYNLSSYDLVTVHKIDPQDEEEVLNAVSADFVVVTIKDQFISRGDMLLFQTKLIGSWIYEGQRLTEPTRGIKAHARDIRHGNFSAKSGIVTEQTNITFRSRSARIVWMVQLSSEMWEYSSPYERQYEPESVCEIYFDQWIRFLYKLFKKWKELEVSHSLTVIFFSRTFLSKGLKSDLDCQDVYGRRYEDHYKPVIENETCIDWDTLIVRIKEEFTKYPLEVGWNLTDRRPSCASQGNLLEAINVVLNLMQYHYLDRDLHRTGQSIVIVSAGCGVFEVDKGLAGITYQRMMDNGIGSDMLSLGLPPLHIAPFFLYNNEYRSVETKGINASETYYEVPHWMHLSFVIYDRPEEKRVYLSGLEDKTTRVQTGHWLDAYDIGANGFIRPQAIEGPDLDSPLMKPKAVNTSSFSAVGNRAATPGKAKVVQEQGQARQLILGRKFRDILEACRPRMVGANMPSALQSLLILRDVACGNETTQKNEVSSSKKNDGRLREWGTVDFNDLTLHSRLKASLTKSPIRKSLRLHSISNSDRSSSTSNDDGSSSSSLGSGSLSSAFGTSFDRVFWDYYETPKVSARAFQMQRSASMDFDDLGRSGEFKPSLGISNQDESASVSDNQSKSSIGGDSEGNQSIRSKSEKHIEQLKNFMDSYNQMVCKPPSEEDESIGERNQYIDPTMTTSDSELPVPTKSGVMMQSIRHRVKEKESFGGLGAALSQYGVTDQAPPIPERSSTLLTRRGSEGLFLTGVKRTPSFNTERRRAASPLLPLRPQQQERSGTPKLFSSIIAPAIDSPNNIRPGQQRRLHVHRPLPNRAATGRERSGSLGGLPMNLSQPATASSNRLSFDLSRQNIVPVSRSPPTNPGPFNTTQRVSIKLHSQSPPRVGSIPHNKLLSRSPPQSEIVGEKPTSSTPPKSSNLQKDRPGSPNLRNLSRDRAASPAHGYRARDRSGSSKGGGRESPHGNSKTHRKKAFNPFRQSDEDEVLAKRSHNRRRWSHVYPEGEVEFKRHAGPIWNSLTSPAILPLSVDHFPTPQELKDENSFQFSFYQVTLGGIENNHYEKHADLLKEMVRQRVTQDFQIVTEAAIAESKQRAMESQREGRNAGKIQSRSARVDAYQRPIPSAEPEMSGGSKRHYLSMGHKIQVMNYDQSSDTIEIVLYNRKSAQNDRANVHTYKFLLFSKVKQSYTTSVQTFKKYSEPYKWNRVDNLICGEADRTMDVGMRFRRVMFGLIPENFKTPEAEEEYVSKFQKLLAYLEKLRDDSSSKLNVEIVTSATRKPKPKDDILRTRQDMTDTMIRFPVQLLRGKKDAFEWIEVAVSAVFDTAASYRMIFNWLVASSTKVETQIQLLQRRFKNFGLKFISFPQTTVSWDLFLHALAVPTFITIRDKRKAEAIEECLLKLDFVHDGVTMTSPQFLECIDKSEDYRFPHYRSGRVKAIPSPQFVHRSGAIFIRKLRDREGKVILVGIENYRHASGENRFREIAKSVIEKVASKIESLPSDASSDKEDASIIEEQNLNKSS